MRTRTPHHSVPRRFSVSIALATLLAVALAATFAPGQTQSQQAAPVSQAVLEKASIRMVAPYTEDEMRKLIPGNPMSTFPTNKFTVRHMTLKSLITLAYGVDRPYIQGGPNWLDEQYYDIEAKVSGDSELTFQQMKPLLQHLFEERFRLKAHREQKIVPGYVLVVATGGPKLQPSNDGEVPHSVHIPYLLQAWHFGTADIATMLVGPVRGPIIDNTGLTSTYDFKLSYRIVNDPNTSVPDLFTAVQEQLGLKLLPEKVPVDTLVIDHVEEKPTEN